LKEVKILLLALAPIALGTMLLPVLGSGDDAPPTAPCDGDADHPEAGRDGAPAPLPGGCTGIAVEPLAGGWSLPGPRELIDANPSALDAPHHDYPAWDWLVPVNTPIYAVRGGTVVSIRSWPHNWWTSGCGQAGGGACSTCGVGVTIDDEQGVRWTYCHGTNVTVALHAQITPGAQIMWSGNTGRSGAPHLHLEIRVGGDQRCPQSLLRSLYAGGGGLDPRALPRHGCFFG
jgi:murein DD-endopeptidase MepM/ murein hydrolase activator NlpD